MKILTRMSLFYLFGLLLLFTKVWGTPYTMADLEILVEGQNFTEFFKHAKDLPPHKRDRHWHEMISTMAQAQVDYYRNKEIYTLEAYQSIEDWAKWPELQNDEFFQVKRNAFQPKYLRQCFVKELDQKNSAHSSTCLEQLFSFWRQSDKKAGLAYELTALHYGMAPFQTEERWPLVKELLKTSEAHFYCDKILVQETVLHYLQKNIIPPTSTHQQKHWALQSFTTPKCWEQLTPYLKASLKTLPFLETPGLFMALSELGKLNGLEKKEWFTEYYLHFPPPGPLLNQAWNTLDTLAQSITKRKEVLKLFQQKDPLPGTLFGQSYHPRAKILIRHLAQSFPEYITLYAQTCVNYMEGGQNFPHGNPTLSCRELFRYQEQNQKALGVTAPITDTIKAKYSALKRESKN